ncbi:ScbR family autoregulator-binding transcription factor [Kitasatospora cineracea]|uniref:ScbR family autoregulator-binding transcription factor n=1 Tax=Kitasatospora cineracea TaxID=88074 RepID=UPI0036D96D78
MQARSERTRRRLVRAGAETFDRSGYASATLDRIARQAGVTKGALYFHFGSKGELADAVQEQALELLEGFLAGQEAAGGEPLQRLIDLTYWLARSLHQEAVVRAGCRLGGERADRAASDGDVRRTWTAETVRLLERARQDGALRRDVGGPGPRTLLTVVVCGLEVLAGSGLSLPELLRRTGELWDWLLPALVPAGHPARYRVREAGVAVAV